MNTTGASKLERMDNRAKAVMAELELHYRAELAETLLSKQPPPPMKRPDGMPPPAKGGGQMVASLMAHFGKDISRKDRRRAAKLMFSLPMQGRSLTASEKARLEKWIQPGAKTPMAERNKLAARLADVMGLEDIAGSEDPDEVTKWTNGLLRGFDPSHPGVSARTDGRDKDEEPGDPDDEPTPTPPPDANPMGMLGSALELRIMRIRCQNETWGEWRADEINYSAIGTDGTLAATASVPNVNGMRGPIVDAGSFSEGDERDFSTLDPLLSWDISGLTQPHLFVGHLAMAEIDRRPSFDFFLWSYLEDVVDEFVQYTSRAAEAAGLGGVTGQAVGAVAILVLGLTTVVGLVVMGVLMLIGAVIGALIWGSQDDIFEVELAFIDLQPNAINLPPFNGNAVSDEFTQRMNGDGGIYEIDYRWELAGAVAGGPGDQDGDT